MSELLRISEETWQAYWDEGRGDILLVVCFLFLLLFPGEKKNRKALAGYTVVFLFLFFFPYTAKIIRLCIGDSVYWRVLWLLPSIFLIAAAFTSFAQRFRESFANGFIVVFLVLTMIFCGRNVYLHGAYEKAENAKEVPADVARICDLLRQDQPEGKIRMATTESAATYVRVYDAGIQMPYGRGGKGVGGWYNRTIYQQMMAPEIDVELLVHCAREKGWDYLVPQLTDPGDAQEFIDAGYEYLGTVDSYYIFRDQISEE